MSHFSVAVLSDGSRGVSVDDLLARYDEDGECEFVDKTDEVEAQYAIGKSVMYLTSSVTDRGRAFGWRLSFDKSKDAREVEVPFSSIYPDVASFASDWHGMSEEPDGRGGVMYGYWENPDAKWDWWVEGGRWHDWAVETLGFVSGMVSDLKTMEFTTHAVVTPDGEWHEVGSMWWFGLSSETEDDVDRWESEYADRFLSDGSLRITIVDCHI